MPTSHALLQLFWISACFGIRDAIRQTPSVHRLEQTSSGHMSEVLNLHNLTNLSAEVQESSAGRRRGARERVVKENTPTPCTKEYSEELVNNAAAAHIAGVKGGHEVPHLLLLLGGSGAGKGTFLRHLVMYGLMDDFVLHGLDEYLEYLPEYKKTISDPKFIYKDAADACYRPGAVPILKAAQKKIISGRINTVFEDTGKKLSRVLERILPPFEKAGYQITVVLVDNNPEVAIHRSVARFQKSGRYSPPDYIEGSFENAPTSFRKLQEMGKAQESLYCDNSCMADGTPFKQALKSKDCLKCWHVQKPKYVWAGQLIPDKILMDGKPTYLHKEARDA